ncbi:helix-turn-helix domain-containing protein [Streptomyces sp. NPDC002671]
MSARARYPSTARAQVEADAAGRGRRDPLLLIGLPALPVAAARPIVLTAAERHRLKKAAWGHKSEHRARVRAQIVLRAARGWSNAHIAVEVGVHVDTVRTWRGRFADLGLPGLADRKCPGRPAGFPPRPAHHCPDGRAQTWPARPSSAASRPSCRHPPCAAGSTRTRSNPGSTAHGSSSPTRTPAQGGPGPGPVRPHVGR